MHPSLFCPPKGGGHTRGFKQKTIPDRWEFDKLIESGSHVIDFGRFLHPGHLMHQASSRVVSITRRILHSFTIPLCWLSPSTDELVRLAQGWGLRQKLLSLGWGFRLKTFLDVKFPWVSPPPPCRAK